MAVDLVERRERSKRRLAELVEHAAVLEETLGGEPLCIYITGSYGREEALVTGDPAADSDLDLFFLYGGDAPELGLPRTTWFRVAGQLIDIADALGFPPFSGDARYLEVHDVRHMLDVLGSPRDDSVNAFTARMLLLMESHPVVNAALYDELVARIVGFYFDDAREHGATFRPTYLLNDVLRFWRTLTLNYEHRRRERFAAAGTDEALLHKARAKTALANFKLGFSRLSTCFSLIVPLASAPTPVTREDVLAMTRQSPVARWEAVPHRLVPELLDLYAWFLEVTGDKDHTATFASAQWRRTAREREHRFGELVFEILRDVAAPEAFRFIVV